MALYRTALYLGKLTSQQIMTEHETILPPLRGEPLPFPTRSPFVSYLCQLWLITHTLFSLKNSLTTTLTCLFLSCNLRVETVPGTFLQKPLSDILLNLIVSFPFLS